MLPISAARQFQADRQIIDQAGYRKVVPLFLSSIAPSTPTVVVPAPPAGFLHVLPQFTVRNTHATLALDWTLTDSLSGVAAALAVAALADSSTGAFSSFFVDPLSGDLSITISGAGGSASVMGDYFRIPLPAGFIQKAQPVNGTYATVSGLVPSFGALEGYGKDLVPTICNGASTTYNGDSAGITVPMIKLTRGGLAIEKIFSGNASAKARAQANHLPVLLPGDTLEAKIASNTVISNSCIMRFIMIQRERAA